MNLHNASGAFLQIAELSQSPDMKRLANALSDAFQALANDLQLLDKRIGNVERDISEVQRKVNQLR